MTNAIGTGTANLSVNAPVDYRAALGRAAFQTHESIGELVRRILPDALEQEARRVEPFDVHAAASLRLQAAQMRVALRMYYGAGVCLVAFVFGLLFGTVTELRRRTEERCDRIEEVREM